MKNGCRLLIAAALAALVTSPGFRALPSFGTASAEEPGPATVLQVQLREYRFEGIPEDVTGPEVRFEVLNAGHSTHELEVRGGDGRVLGRVDALPPGASATLALRLEPGSYLAQCLVPAGRKTHADFGMRQGFAVQ